MSDLMLLGVLRMPLELVNTRLAVAQLVGRANQAADRIEADAAEIESLKAALKGLSGMYTYAWDRIEGGLVMFDLERFETAHKNARIALGTPFLDFDTGEPEA